MSRPPTELVEKLTAAETMYGVDGVTRTLTLFCDERTRATPVEIAGTSTEEAVTGTGSGDGRRTLSATDT